MAEKLDRLPAAGSGGSQPAQVAAPAPLGAEAIGPLLRPLQDRLDMAVSQLGVMSQRVGGNPAETLGPVLVQIRDGVQGQLASLAEGIRYLQQRLDGGLQYLAEQLQPPQPDQSQADESPIGPAGSADWQRAILARIWRKCPAWRPSEDS